MTNSKSKIKKVDFYQMKKHSFIIFVIFAFFCGLTSGLFGASRLDGYILEHNLQVYVPSNDIIRTVCKSNGYIYGWLDAYACSENEVMCHTKQNGLTNNTCINIKGLAVK